MLGIILRRIKCILARRRAAEYANIVTVYILAAKYVGMVRIYGVVIGPDNSQLCRYCMVRDGVVMEFILSTKSYGPQPLRRPITCKNDARSTISLRPMPFMLDKPFTWKCRGRGCRQPSACKTKSQNASNIHFITCAFDPAFKNTALITLITAKAITVT
jgi:hypothetical protein